MKTALKCRAALGLTLASLTAPLISQGQQPPPADHPPGPPRVVEQVEVRDVFAPVAVEIQHAQAEVSRAMKDMDVKLRALKVGFQGPDASRLLVVPPGDATGEQVGQLREDLAIMSRVLQKAANPEAGKRPSFRLHFGDVRWGGQTDLDALYLDGFGALFLLNVDFPLTEAAKDTDTPKEKQGAKDTAWEQARRELSGRPDDELHWSEDSQEDGPKPFDAEKVSSLKQRLIQALASAGNIRALKSGDQVVVQVTGRSPRQPRPAITQGRSGGVGGAYRSAVFLGDGPEPGPAATLTLKVKKSDLDRRATGGLGEQDFAKTVTVMLREESTPPITPVSKP